MGNSQNPHMVSIGMKQFLQQQFNRVKKDEKKKYITVSELLEAKHPEDFPFSFAHLGILYVCDQTKNGMFTLQDFEQFIVWIQQNLVSVQMYEFQAELQAQTVAILIEKLQQKQGQAYILKWFIKMFSQDAIKKKIDGQVYIQIDSIKILHQVFNVKVMNDMDIQSFFYLMKKSAEDMGYHIQEVIQHEQDYEEYIALTVCEQFVRSFLKGMKKVLKDVGYQNSPF